MTTRIIGVLWLMLGFSALWPCPTFASLGSSQAPVVSEQPSPVVQKLLDKAQCLEDDQPLESLKIVDEALEIARRANDLVSEAQAQEARGSAFERLNFPEEAMVARREAVYLWERKG